ncbi:GIY-YIG nuclease family protein [Streptomyces sp. NPDC059454]|uniref:GIY-YIG nuclease family protein n=1 Tax=Streptomyces sp. NPDC059454 TaxID=3346836 RepID=UPI003688F08B
MAGISGVDGRGEFHDDFRLSITRALGDQLAKALNNLGTAQLSEENLAKLEERPGVYQLYVNGQIVYVGKADQKTKGLPGRLRNHLRKIGGRLNIDLAEVTFSCLYVDDDFYALGPEQLLINHYKNERGGLPWNNSGFGSRDPGSKRDTTVLKKDHFDVQYPINLAAPVEGVRAGTTSLRKFLKSIKDGLPYLFRYVEPPRAAEIMVEVPAGAITADQALRLAGAAIPPSWQITALLGYVIMYDKTEEYASATRYYRPEGVTDQEPQKDSAPLTADDLTE